MTPGRDRLDLTRRRLLQAGGLGLGAAVLGLAPLARLLAKAAAPDGVHAGYGALRPVRDLNTGLPLLELPEGFSYRSFGWAGEPMFLGVPTPPAHDGMGVVAAEGHVVTLVRNHEVARAEGSFAPSDATYDAPCAGGTVTLRYDLERGELLDARASLSGTLRNCSGGVTPWGSWLSCEEFVSRAGRVGLDGPDRQLLEDHGFVFEVPAGGRSSGRPLTGLGQFRHEAAAIDAASGIVYQTEDLSPAAGFYRFVPAQPGQLGRGGQLQMLQAVGRPDLRQGLRSGERLRVRWVDIDHPERGMVGADIDGVLRQGLAAGGSRFSRLEGCIAGDDQIYFTATDGGDARCGQVWAYRPGADELHLVLESTDPDLLDYPDNLVPSPRGGLLICEDSRGAGQRLYGLTAGGGLFEFARNAVVLDGAKGHSGDFRRAEWAGVCFSPDGGTLFANIYAPGFTVAITGPWRAGLV